MKVNGLGRPFGCIVVWNEMLLLILSAHAYDAKRNWASERRNGVRRVMNGEETVPLKVTNSFVERDPSGGSRWTTDGGDRQKAANTLMDACRT